MRDGFVDSFLPLAHVFGSLPPPSGSAAACLSAGLQPVPPSRSLSLSTGASAGEEISPPASLQRAPIPTLSPGRRKLRPTG